VQPAGQQKLLVYFHLQPGMSGFGYSVPTGVPLQVTANDVEPQLGEPQPEQSFAVGVHCSDGGSDGASRVGQLEVQRVHTPPWQVLLPVQVPHTPPQPLVPHCLPEQLGVQATVQPETSNVHDEHLSVPV
jgi:hypothetical protein